MSRDLSVVSGDGAPERESGGTDDYNDHGDDAETASVSIESPELTGKENACR